jgi:hypothetical protein
LPHGGQEKKHLTGRSVGVEESEKEAEESRSDMWKCATRNPKRLSSHGKLKMVRVRPAISRFRIFPTTFFSTKRKEEKKWGVSSRHK